MPVWLPDNPLHGLQVDASYWGGQHRGGKRGRGAVEVTVDGWPHKLRIAPRSGLALATETTEATRCPGPAAAVPTVLDPVGSPGVVSSLREPVQCVRDQPVVLGELAVVGGQVVHMPLQLLDLPVHANYRS